jgi:hypothetical protein
MKRQCGECTLCCKLLPVPDLKKLAGARCAHQRMGKGCAIYPKHPLSCEMWSCAWLVDEDAGELRRPDRSHYVVDIMPDFVTMTYENEPSRRLPVLQIWIDPKYPDAHRDPALRAYIQRKSDETGGMAAIVRYDSANAFVIFPPTLASDGQWHEEHSGMSSRQHTAAEIAAALAGA